MTRIALAVAFSVLACGTGAARAADDTAELEAKLAAAQVRLEQAANEIAALSAQLGEPMMRRMIIRGAEAPPPLIGVTFDPASGEEGARVLDVSPGGPAATAGVREGDLIVAVNGESMVGRDRVAREVTRALRASPPERTVKLKVQRAGKPLELAVTPRTLRYDATAFAIPEPFTAALPMPPMPPMPPIPPDVLMSSGGVFAHGAARSAMSSLELVTLTPGLGEYFGADKGVLVVRAPKDGTLQLQEGDVIQAIGSREPTSGAHATRILASYQPGENVSIKVLRRRKVVTLNASFPG